MRIILLLFLLFNYSYTQDHFPGSSISKEKFIKHVFVLGADKFEGRGTGETGGGNAAQYLADEFKKLALIPIGDDSTYFQNIRMHGGKPLQSSKLVLHQSNVKTIFNFSTDYLLYFSGEQTFIPSPLELVFAGYGIIAPEYDYNDYQSVDAEGKIVVMIGGEPASDDNTYFYGDKPTIHSYPDIKQRIALSRGARGSIMIPDPAGNSWENLMHEFSFEDVTLAYSAANTLAVLFNPEKADILFGSSPFTLSDVYRMKIKGNMKSFSMNCRISFKGDFKERDFIASNVIGLVKGSHPKLKDEYIIVSAHYDHLGIGDPVKGDSIYNGVFDNAAGVSALLEIARIFSFELKPERSVIFLLLTGEEKGLLGSVHYTGNPAVPLYKTTANINIDGIALFDNFKSIIGVGAEHSTLIEFLKITAAKNNVGVTDIPEGFINYDAFSRSDQAAFAAAGIPSLLITEAPDYVNISDEEGLKKFIHYSENIYHTPFDDLNQGMNYDAAVQHLNIILDFCRLLSASDQRPEWNDDSPYLNARLRSEAEQR